MYEDLSILAAFVFLYSITCGGLERTPINGAIVFTAFGLAFGSLGLGLLTLDVGAEGLNTLAELTLALVLFTDAANANLSVLKKAFHIPQRLLLIGLPLTILLGFGAGVLLFGGLTLFEIAILATMLAPTDAALGKAVVTNESVPTDIRESLNVESGLNDGICVPILFLVSRPCHGFKHRGQHRAACHDTGRPADRYRCCRRRRPDSFGRMAAQAGCRPRMDHRDLAAAARRGAGSGLLRRGTEARGQRFHRLLFRRFAVR